jgi:hypothetical protein
MEALTARMTDPATTLSELARALDELGDAATHVAGALGGGETVAELAVCSFCFKAGTQVRRVVAGPDALICDECIRLCVEVLDDQRGDN